MSGCANAGQALSRGLKLYTTRSTYSLPFLYQTPTLRRYYSALQDLANENVAKASPKTKIRKPERETTPEPASAPAAPRAKLEKEEYVPFETYESAEPTVRSAPVKGETLTPKERYAFDQLEALSGTPQPPNVKKQQPKKPAGDVFLDLDEVLNEAIQNVESVAQAKRAAEVKAEAAASKKRPAARKSQSNILNPAPRITQPETSSSTTDARAAYSRELHEARSLHEESERMIVAMKHAPTDFALWSILETDLFTPIANLQLDGPSPDPSAPTTATPPPTTPKDRRNLMRTFPKRLILAASLLRTVYPTSNLILSILPRLRAIGPSVYALGITPNLCNQLLAFHFQKHLDLDACNSLLSEMESSIIEPNATTLQILNYILNYKEQAKEGKMGVPMQSVFGTEKFRRGFRELEGWRVKVETSLEEFEIREQRKAANEEARVADERKEVRYIDFE
ncbi:hypothetical protein VTO58DRAFT_104097 [Aureobasidium pullulans]|nr:hypothetical protein JADG_007829 [Aureobasidium pullulans]